MTYLLNNKELIKTFIMEEISIGKGQRVILIV